MEAYVTPGTSGPEKNVIDYNVAQSVSVMNTNGFYTLNGILDYLQIEWAKMEMERTEWTVERAEMQARIAFMQGELKGQENLKTDLVRRIKMLEYALMQERAKVFEFKHPNETRPTLPTLDCDLDAQSGVERGLSKLESESARWREERCRLKDYLVSAGLGDAMVQLRKTRVQDLLAFTAGIDNIASANGELTRSVAATINALGSDDIDDVTETTAALDSLQLNALLPTLTDETGFGADLSELVKPIVSELGDTLDVTDPETAEALAEFDLLVAQQTALDSCHSYTTDDDGGGDSQHPSASFTSSPDGQIIGKDWDAMDEKELLNRFTEQYRAERSKAIRQPGRLSGGSPRPIPGSLHASTNPSSDEEMDYDTSISEDIDVKRPELTVFPPSSQSDDFADEDAFTTVLSGQSGAPSSPTELLGSRHHASSTTGSISPTSSPTTTNSPTATNTSNNAVPTSLGLGDLACLTVANESGDAGRARAMAAAMDNLDGVGDLSANTMPTNMEPSAHDGTATSTSEATAHWTARYTLRSHFDAIHAVQFHPTKPMLVTASEDHTLKWWNLQKTVQAKKSTIFDVEPVYTFRGHENPILALSLWTHPLDDVTGSPVYIYSGDLHGNLRAWRLDNLHPDPYDVFQPSVIGPRLRGHTDAIWSLVGRPDGALLSASADGTACLWTSDQLVGQSPTPSVVMDPVPAARIFQLTATMMTTVGVQSVAEFATQAPVPTSISFVKTDVNRFVAGFTSGHLSLFDAETGQLITTFSSAASTKSDASPSMDNGSIGSTSCNSVVTHPHQPLVISAHEDRQIRFHDINSGKCVHSMVAHLDAVNAVTVDPQGAYLLSASHDCSIRSWNIGKKTCIQEITSHRKKFDESIHAVAFHPTKHLMASAGADALCKVFV